MILVGNPASVEPRKLDYTSPKQATSPSRANLKSKLTDSPSRLVNRSAEEAEDGSDDGDGGLDDAFDALPSTPQRIGRDGDYQAFAVSSPRCTPQITLSDS